MQNYIGQQIDRYRITERLGMGGMAVVYKAYDTRLERDVALKLIRTESISEDQHSRLMKRFEREAKALGCLHHPNIVSVFDYGDFGGIPYLILEYLPGRTLKEVEKPVSVEQAAKWLAPIAHALDHTHKQNILHRDVKPSNILLTPQDETKLSDFGIAKLIEISNEVTLTGEGVGIGTPEYMAPEQGLGRTVDGRADIYALGVVFYELVTGVKPFTADTPMAVMIKQINDPLPLPTNVAPNLPIAIEKILIKALAKNPLNRFGEMREFAALLDIIAQGNISTNLMADFTPIGDQSIKYKLDSIQFQQKEPGRETETWDEFKQRKSITGNQQKKVSKPKRNRLISLLISIAVVTIFIGLRTLYPAFMSNRSVDNDQVEVGLPVANSVVRNEIEYDESTNELIENTPSNDRVEQIEIHEQSDALFATAVPVFSTEKITKENAGLIEVLGRLGRGTIGSIALSPDGTMLSVAGGIGIYLYEYESMELLLYMNTEYSVKSITFSPNGDVLASGNDQGVIALWDVETGRLLRTLEGKADWDNQVVYSPDGRLLAAKGEDRTVILWDAISGNVLHVLEEHFYTVQSISFTPDGLFLAAGDDDSNIFIWNTQTGKLVDRIEAQCGPIESLVYFQDGRLLATGCSIGYIILWDVSSRNQTQKFVGGTSSIVNLALSPDGSLLAAGSSDGNIILWDVDSGLEQLSLLGHTNSLNGLFFSSDGESIVSASTDGTARIWDVRSGFHLDTLEGHISSISGISFSFSNNLAALGTHDGKIFLWNFATGHQIRVVDGFSYQQSCVDISPDGSLLAAGDRDGNVRLWEAETGRQIVVFEGHKDEVLSVSFSPDGAKLASGGSDGALRVWDVDSQKLIDAFGSEGNAVYSIGFSPDGAILASGSNYYTVDLWDVRTGERVQPIEVPLSIIYGLAFSANGDILAVSGMYHPSFQMEAINAIYLYDTKTGELLNTLSGEGYYTVSSVAFTPDGTLLASGSGDGIIRLWDVKTAELIVSLEAHLGGINSVDFFNDGAMLASGSGDGTIRLWGVPEH
jgi:WD40 repeat protein